jgi:hypothetical protein
MTQLDIFGRANSCQSGHMFTAIAIVIAFLAGVAAARGGRGMITGFPFDPTDPRRKR